MKLRNIVWLLFAAALLSYVGWALMLTYRGHTIGRHDTARYQVRVHRVPFGFSLLTPAYGTRIFPGYVRMTVSSSRGMPIASYSVNLDSFYPEKATITMISGDHIQIDLDGTNIVCQMDRSTIQWTVASK